MASMAQIPVKTGVENLSMEARKSAFKVEKCRVRDKLIFAFLLSVNRLNEDMARVEFARTPEFREEARIVLEQSRRKTHKLQGLIVMHCLNHKC